LPVHKADRSEADHSALSRAKVMKAWSCATTIPYNHSIFVTAIQQYC
jgi:hypothetical protein